MRTTVDLPPALHHRVSRTAAARGVSLSSMISELTALGLEYSQEDHEEPMSTSPVTGLPQLRAGRPITADEVADFLAESE
ncbi:toxin-antitoxin system, antitoxin component [Actinomyces bowdenii]|uniref:Toxin-antitoxin system, antitoxin component n=1 Tax=Actinomyces bowdenii TaxID=131109 RepID=A0A853EGY4_9ACTO|nr:toxin-antitoxin system, antitoxin component [Actinomyces bowdenii]MBF0696490.1 toxin-antitoxin system, antitoxin component [Actinomyces bowdenii]MCR2053166.1 toxin-antitoxin system, antitoxin component [Actinomyces bowdenii]NYS68663.1 toxin-antitoxin system, antitoxin component [Actinomyces bowdenii]